MPRALRIPATDGLPLAATLHEPVGTALGLVVVSPATAVRRSYYDVFAAYLAGRGFIALTYDLRGVGQSKPAPKDARMRDWGAKDMAGVLAWAEKEAPDLPRFLVGHSVGGQVVGLAEGSDRLAGIVSVASQHGNWRLWPAPARFLRAFQWYVAAPLVVPLAGKLPRRVLGEELPKGVALEWARWCRSPEFLLAGEPMEVRARFAGLRAPWLAYSFGDDDYGPHEVSDALMGLYPKVRLERRRVEPQDVGADRIGHFGFFRPRFERTLWNETVAWLEKRAAEAA